MPCLERLDSDIAPTGAELVLEGSVKRIGVTYRDDTGIPVNPGALSLEITDNVGSRMLADTYLPLVQRDPNPPRIINPSIGRFEFPLGLDNGISDYTKTNRTETRCDLMFKWAVAGTAGVFASLSAQNLVWTANQSGTPGQFITVQFTTPGTPSAALQIIRTGADILISLATNTFSQPITTAAQLLTAIQANTDISSIVSIVLATGFSGSNILTSMAKTPLSGGIDASSELSCIIPVKIINHRMQSLLPKLRLMIDKAVKFVDEDDRENSCYLGYTQGQLAEFIEGGLQIINAYQPSGIFSIDTYPFSNFEFTLIECALMAGVMSQQLFAVDTDIPNWNDQGNSFTIAHQPQLASYLNWLAARLDKMIPIMKLNFVNSGSLHIEAGPNYRLAQLISAAPSGAVFRNMYVSGS